MRPITTNLKKEGKIVQAILNWTYLIDRSSLNRVGRILNVSTEIDNYYPETFDYLNVRVNDDDSTELLFHWEKTYRYICKSV